MINKIGHTDSILGHKRTHDRWFPWIKCNCKQCVELKEMDSSARFPNFHNRQPCLSSSCAMSVLSECQTSSQKNCNKSLLLTFFLLCKFWQAEICMLQILFRQVTYKLHLKKQPCFLLSAHCMQDMFTLASNYEIAHFSCYIVFPIAKSWLKKWPLCTQNVFFCFF